MGGFNFAKVTSLDGGAVCELGENQNPLERGNFEGAAHACRLGLYRHSRERGNPVAGQPGRHNKRMKMKH
jgi:hypothetical protein